MRKLLWLVTGLSLGASGVFAQAPKPGPYYFMSDALDGKSQFPWGKTTSFGGITVIENFSLLAHVLGDVPEARKGAKLVPKESFNTGTRTITLQAFAFMEGKDGLRQGLDLAAAAPNLKKFLEDPLGGGTKFDLTLPFKDRRVALSDSSGLLRNSPGDACWHTAIDFDVSGSSTAPFDVVAPADGVVEGNADSPTLAIRHVAANGKEFLTLYSHIVPSSKSRLKKGTPVKRGELIGRVDEGGKYTHLHFGVAVKGPGRSVKGVSIPELWYVIDPFGVYDYRRDRDSTTAYNYLPNNTLAHEVRGVHMAYVFRTNPLIDSLPPEAAPAP